MEEVFLFFFIPPLELNFVQKVRCCFVLVFSNRNFGMKKFSNVSVLTKIISILDSESVLCIVRFCGPWLKCSVRRRGHNERDDVLTMNNAYSWPGYEKHEWKPNMF